jgi:hypothetical protein
MLNQPQVQVLVALIAAISALIVAIFQFVSQRRAAKDLERVKASLDKQKSESIEYFKTYLGMLTDGAEQRLLAFKNIIQATQLLRDKVRRFAHHQGAYSAPLYKRDIAELVESVTHTYSESLIYLEENERVVAHNLKNACRDLSDAFQNHHEHSPLADAELAEVIRREKQIADLQTDLRTLAHLANSAFINSLKVKAGRLEGGLN